MNEPVASTHPAAPPFDGNVGHEPTHPHVVALWGLGVLGDGEGVRSGEILMAKLETSTIEGRHVLVTSVCRPANPPKK